MRAAPRHARHPAPVPHAPVSGGAGVRAAPMAHAVVPCALVPATPCNQHHPSPRNRARRTPLTPSVLARRTPPRSRPLKPPRPSPPRTPVLQPCPAACCQRATPPPAGHARRPETRQAPRARAARTCLRWRRCRCRSHGACRCPMRPRTCHPMQSSPPQPPQPRPSHPPASRLLQPRASSASRTPARVPHAPVSVGEGHYALSVPLPAAPLARVGPISKRVRARALLRHRHSSRLYETSSRGDEHKAQEGQRRGTLAAMVAVARCMRRHGRGRGGARAAACTGRAPCGTPRCSGR